MNSTISSSKLMSTLQSDLSAIECEFAKPDRLASDNDLWLRRADSFLRAALLLVSHLESIGEEPTASGLVDINTLDVMISKCANSNATALMRSFLVNLPGYKESEIGDQSSISDNYMQWIAIQAKSLSAMSVESSS